MMGGGNSLLDVLFATLIFYIVGKRRVSLLRASMESLFATYKLHFLALHEMLLLHLRLIVELKGHLVIQTVIFVLFILRLGSLLDHAHLFLIFHYWRLIQFSLLMLKSHLLGIRQLSRCSASR